eukprot:jgi/Mesvir1/27185/Mv07763-RA.1
MIATYTPDLQNVCIACMRGSPTFQVVRASKGDEDGGDDKKEKKDKDKKEKKKEGADGAVTSAATTTSTVDAATETEESEDSVKKEKKKKKDKGNGENGSEVIGVEGWHQLLSESKVKGLSPDDNFDKTLRQLQIELVKMQEWVSYSKMKVCVLFEGRDAAGKGGIIKRITEPLNPRVCRVVALGTPTEKERSQWYFQRYVSQLPSGGEITLFDRSWYNRAGVEKVMGFCTDDEYREFLRTVPDFERSLIRAGIVLVKYWFSVSYEEQGRRLQERAENPYKRWKLSPMDLKSREKWVEYSIAKDEMLRFTDTKQSPWWVVRSDNKKNAQLNTIHHLLHQIDYKEVPKEKLIIPNMDANIKYERIPERDQTFIPEIFKF